MRKSYFACENPDCKRPFVVPCGPGDLTNARDIGYKPYKLAKCPKHSLYAGTEMLMNHPVFVAALRYKDQSICGRGVLNEPVNFGEFVNHARNEFAWFQQLIAERRRKK